MPAGKCDHCGVDEYMPYVCKFCKGRYCAAHRLPENHGCAGLDPFRERLRAEGRVMAPAPGIVRPSYSATARTRMSMDSFWSRVNGKMTFVFLGIIAAVYVVQWIVAVSAPELYDDIFPIESDWATQPWTIFASIFSHSLTSLNHILFNALALFFFGTALERIIGSRRFTWLFLAGGALAGIGHIVITQSLFGVAPGAVGASGAIMALMGTLVVLAPRLSVLVFFVIPAPLWAITIFYVALDLLGAVTPGSATANIAHLVGLAAGLAYGYYLRAQGMRVRIEQPPPMRRTF